MKKSILVMALSLSSVVFAGQYEIPGVSVSTSDFTIPSETYGNSNPNVQKISKDDRCTIKRSDWTGEAWYSLYVYDSKDGDFQGSITIRNTNSGIELIGADGINSKCDLKVQTKNGVTTITDKCDSLGNHDKLSLSVDAEGIIREVSFVQKKAGIGGHIPAPYVYSKKLSCEF